MGFLDKAKSVAVDVTAKAKEGDGDDQAKVELERPYNERGKIAFEPVENNDRTLNGFARCVPNWKSSR